MIGEVMAFFGLGWGEVIGLEFRWFSKLYRRIPVIEARRQLAWVPVVAYPHVDAEARAAIQERLMRASGYARQRQEALAEDRFEAGWAQLRGFGIHASQLGPTDGAQRAPGAAADETAAAPEEG